MRHREAFSRNSSTRRRGDAAGSELAASLLKNIAPEEHADESRTHTVYWDIHDFARDYKPVRGAAGLSQILGRERCCNASPGRVEGMHLRIVSEPFLSNLWDIDPAPVRGAAGHGSYRRRHHSGEDRF